MAQAFLTNHRTKLSKIEAFQDYFWHAVENSAELSFTFTIVFHSGHGNKNSFRLKFWDTQDEQGDLYCFHVTCRYKWSIEVYTSKWFLNSVGCVKHSDLKLSFNLFMLHFHVFIQKWNSNRRAAQTFLKLQKL